VLLLDLTQLRGTRGHHIIGWRYKRVPTRSTFSPNIEQYNEGALGGMRYGLPGCHTVLKADRLDA
jgi:hypothetical protein